jgi:4-diphosphocytidyl-2C-methyl-D-erythritol kinase
MSEAFENWATDFMPWFITVKENMAEGIGEDLAQMKDRQIKYSSYLARLTEPLATAEGFYLSALADEMTKLKEAGFSPMLIGRVAEGRVKNEAILLRQVKQTVNTLDTLLITIASRLKHEKPLNPF